MIAPQCRRKAGKLSEEEKASRTAAREADREAKRLAKQQDKADKAAQRYSHRLYWPGWFLGHQRSVLWLLGTQLCAYGSEAPDSDQACKQASKACCAMLAAVDSPLP